MYRDSFPTKTLVFFVLLSNNSYIFKINKFFNVLPCPCTSFCSSFGRWTSSIWRSSRPTHRWPKTPSSSSGQSWNVRLKSGQVNNLLNTWISSDAMIKIIYFPLLLFKRTIFTTYLRSVEFYFLSNVNCTFFWVNPIYWLEVLNKNYWMNLVTSFSRFLHKNF